VLVVSESIVVNVAPAAGAEVDVVFDLDVELWETVLLVPVPLTVIIVPDVIVSNLVASDVRMPLMRCTNCCIHVVKLCVIEPVENFVVLSVDPAVIADCPTSTMVTVVVFPSSCDFVTASFGSVPAAILLIFAAGISI